MGEFPSNVLVVNYSMGSAPFSFQDNFESTQSTLYAHKMRSPNYLPVESWLITNFYDVLLDFMASLEKELPGFQLQNDNAPSTLSTCW